MAGYRRIKNVVTSEDGEPNVIVGQEGLKVPSAVAKLAAGPSVKRADGHNARSIPNKEGKLMAGQVTKLTGRACIEVTPLRRDGLAHARMHWHRRVEQPQALWGSRPRAAPGGLNAC